jgi:hypothetical protein
MIAQAPRLPYIPPVQTLAIPINAGSAQGGDCGIRVDKPALEAKEVFDSREKFGVFAFASTMLVPNAPELFKRFLRHEEFRKRLSDKAARIEDESAREKVKEAQFHQRLNRLCRVAEDTWWFPNATANSISTKGPVFHSPNWMGEPRPLGAETLKWVTDEFEESAIKLLRDCGFSWQSLGLQPFSADAVSDFEKEQRALEEKNQRMRKLLIALNSSKSRMSTAMSNAVFDVLVDGTKLGHAASARGMKPRSLSMAIHRVTGRLQNLGEVA